MRLNRLRGINSRCRFTPSSTMLRKTRGSSPSASRRFVTPSFSISQSNGVAAPYGFLREASHQDGSQEVGVGADALQEQFQGLLEALQFLANGFVDHGPRAFGGEDGDWIGCSSDGQGGRPDGFG